MTLEELKRHRVAWIKVNCRNRLKETDWAWVRQLERGTPVPPQVTADRQAIIAYCDGLEAAILAAPDEAALLAIDCENGWPTP